MPLSYVKIKEMKIRAVECQKHVNFPYTFAFKKWVKK